MPPVLYFLWIHKYYSSFNLNLIIIYMILKVRSELAEWYFVMQVNTFIDTETRSQLVVPSIFTVVKLLKPFPVMVNKVPP